MSFIQTSCWIQNGIESYLKNIVVLIIFRLCRLPDVHLMMFLPDEHKVFTIYKLSKMKIPCSSVLVNYLSNIINLDFRFG